MLKRVVIASLLAVAPVSAAQAQTIVLLPEAGSMSPPTVIVDPRASKHDPVLVCVSMAQLSAGSCRLRNVTTGGSRRH